MDDVSLDELKSDYIPVIPTVIFSISIRLRPDACHVRWHEFRLHLKSIKLPSDTFLFTDALQIAIKNFSCILRYTKLAGLLCRPLEAIEYFPNLSDIVAEECNIKRYWQNIEILLMS